MMLDLCLRRQMARSATSNNTQLQNGYTDLFGVRWPGTALL